MSPGPSPCLTCRCSSRAMRCVYELCLPFLRSSPPPSWSILFLFVCHVWRHPSVCFGFGSQIPCWSRALTGSRARGRTELNTNRQKGRATNDNNNERNKTDNKKGRHGKGRWNYLQHVDQLLFLCSPFLRLCLCSDARFADQLQRTSCLGAILKIAGKLKEQEQTNKSNRHTPRVHEGGYNWCNFQCVDV